MKDSRAVLKLIDEFSKLPSVGRKTAQRLAYHILSCSEEDALSLASAIEEARSKVSFCPECFNYAEGGLCEVCADNGRDRTVVCVVETPKEIPVMESVNEYEGVYHVLHGVISPLRGIGPDALKIKELITRAGRENVSEVIMALDFSVESEATVLYVTRLLKPCGITVSRLATGIPAGSSLEFADSMTLRKALKGRITL